MWCVYASNPAHGKYFVGEFSGTKDEAIKKAKEAFRNFLNALGEPMLKKATWSYAAEKVEVI